MRQYSSLQAGRGIAALLVVCHHAGTYAKDPRYWNRPSIFLALQGTEYFFVLSGVVILLAHWQDLGRPAATASYVWKRFRRIYPIYWLVLVPTVLVYQLHPHLGVAYERNPWVIVSGFLLVHINSMDQNLPVAWTLFHEVLFYAVFATFLFAKRQVAYGVLGVWCLLSVVMWIHPLETYISSYLFSPLHLLFVLGMGIAWLLHERKLRGAMAAAALGLLVLGYTMTWPVWHDRMPTSVFMLAGLGSGLVIFGCAALEEQGKLAVPAVLKFLGDCSYSLYLIHFPFFMAGAPLVYRAWQQTRLPVAIPLVVLVMLSTVAGCLMHLYVERPLLAWMRRARRATA